MGKEQKKNGGDCMNKDFKRGRVKGCTNSGNVLEVLIYRLKDKPQSKIIPRFLALGTQVKGSNSGVRDMEQKGYFILT